MNPIDNVLEFARELRDSGANLRPRSVQYEIDGLTYTSNKVAASVGLELLPRVVALFGSALSQALATGDLAKVNRAEVALRMADRAMRDGLVPLALDLLRGMSCSKVYPTEEAGEVLKHFDDHFAGEYEHLFKVLTFALAHNFRGPTRGVR